MKICFIAPANSAHIVKWCNYFVSTGHEVHVVSFTEGYLEGVKVHYLQSNVSASGSDLQKLLYLFYAGRVRKILKDISPDIINVHYATSYGTVAALAGLKPYILSVWGSDIYEFPQRSVLHRLMLKFSLNRAAVLFSTSQAMADEAQKYTKKAFEITPFGVDLELFSPLIRDRKDADFVVGTVKSLAPAYGIDTLLKAVSILKLEKTDVPIQLRIAGKGPQEKEYHEMAEQLNISDITTWLGYISQEKAAKEWANMDVAVICSNSESFGVSAVEAQACGCAIVISDVPGLMEATKPDVSSIVVSRKDERALADALYDLYCDRERRAQMGNHGRLYVEQNYEINNCFQKVEHLFRDIFQ